MTHARIISGLAAIGLMACGCAFAQSDYRAPWRGDFRGYAGASGGESKFRAECASTDVFACDKRDTAFKVYAGGKINEVLALEIGYTDFGKIRASGGDTDAWAVPLSLVAGFPLGERFGVFGKVGGLYGRTDVTASASTLLDTGHKSGWGWTYGAGATFALSPQWQIRADWDRYKLDFVGGERDIDMLSAGVQVRF
ncbi:MAG: outer membrane beta-barrel protein [Usitatibacter sp.]